MELECTILRDLCFFSYCRIRWMWKELPAECHHWRHAPGGGLRHNQWICRILCSAGTPALCPVVCFVTLVITLVVPGMMRSVISGCCMCRRGSKMPPFETISSLGSHLMNTSTWTRCTCVTWSEIWTPWLPEIRLKLGV